MSYFVTYVNGKIRKDLVSNLIHLHLSIVIFLNDGYDDIFYLHFFDWIKYWIGKYVENIS